MASNLRAIASTLVAMASTLRGKSSSDFGEELKRKLLVASLLLLDAEDRRLQNQPSA